MPAPYHARPGGNAVAPTYIPQVTPSGALDVGGATVTDTNKVTPLKSFAYIYQGQPYTFFLNMPRVVAPGLKAELLAAGLVS